MCGLRVDVEGDRVARIVGDEEDPFSEGHICPKALALKDLHEDPDRLRQPMRRNRAGRWDPVPWDEALSEAAHRLHGIQQRHGRNAVGAYLGNPTVHNLSALMYAPVFLKGLRTKNRFSATSVDQLPHMFAAYYMLGHQLLLPVPDVDRTEHMLILGANPLASNGSLMTAPNMKRRLEAIRERGGKVIVVDPRRTETARLASEHVFIRPGTDAMLLLAMLQHILDAHGARLGRLGAHCDGIDTVRAVVAPFSPERAAGPTGIAEAEIRRLADELVRAKRGVVYGRIGTCTQAFGALCQWAINLLNLVTDNFDREGGAMFTTPAVDAIALGGTFGAGRGSHGRWKSRVRGLPEFGGELPVSTLAEEILTSGAGQIRAMVTVAGNPALSTPNGGQLDRALASLEFMVSVDFFLNETTRHAHLILPPTSPLEHGHYDLAFHLLQVRNTAKWSDPLFEPPPGAKSDGEILLELLEQLEALRHGRLSQQVLTARALRKAGPERTLDVALRIGPRGSFNPFSKGLTLDRLRRHPHGIDYGPLEPRLPGRLMTGDRRIALAPSVFVEDLARLDAAFPTTAEPVAPGGLLLIGRRQLRSNNSWLHNVPMLVKGKRRCTLLIHPDDAAARGLEDGALARITSRVGKVDVPVQISADLMPGVVSLPHGFGHDRPGVKLRVASTDAHAGVSMNDLTDDQEVDALSGNAILTGVPVEVERAAEAAE